MAQLNYEQNSATKGPELKIKNDYNFVEYVENKILNERYSPDAVIMKLQKNDFIDPSTVKPFKTKIGTKIYTITLIIGFF